LYSFHLKRADEEIFLVCGGKNINKGDAIFSYV
jgi:hypothetical protein